MESNKLAGSLRCNGHSKQLMNVTSLAGSLWEVTSVADSLWEVTSSQAAYVN